LTLGLALVCSLNTTCAQESKVAGTWNYDQPNPKTGINIAIIHTPQSAAGMQGEFVVPQVGNIVLSSEGDGRLTGRTDQGCTWTFQLEAGTSTLAPATQTCFNKVIGSRYTITRWSISLTDERHAAEDIRAISHLPMGDSIFELATGRRTKAGNEDVSRLFEGSWSYDAADPRTRVNIAQESCGQNRSAADEHGSVVIRKEEDHVLIAATPGGCFWRLTEHGSTAVLAGQQSCEAEGHKTDHGALDAVERRQPCNIDDEADASDPGEGVLVAPDVWLAEPRVIIAACAAVNRPT